MPNRFETTDTRTVQRLLENSNSLEVKLSPYGGSVDMTYKLEGSVLNVIKEGEGPQTEQLQFLRDLLTAYLEACQRREDGDGTQCLFD